MNAASFHVFDDLMHGIELGTSNNDAHGLAHQYIGGTIGDMHTAFRDPFVLLIHSNVDRLWAMWQTQPGHPERLDPNYVYGTDGSDLAMNNPMQPWAGEANWMNPPTAGWPVRPWYAPENQQVVKTCKDPSVVEPPRYDTLPEPPRKWRVSWGGRSRWEQLNTAIDTFGVGIDDLAFGDFNGSGRTDVFRAVGGIWLVSWGGTAPFYGDQ